jgi:outer membrane lipoprotein carrier protein
VLRRYYNLWQYQPHFKKEKYMKVSLASLILCCTLFISLFSPAPARAAAALKDVVAAVEKSYNSLTDLQASFSQKTLLPSVKKEQKGNGTLSLRKNPGGAAMFRFDYTKPRQLIVSDGTTVWFYLPENKQVMEAGVSKLFEGGNSVTLNYLTGIGRISRDFTITFLNGGHDAAGNYLLELVPKKPSRNLAKLQLTVSAEAVERYMKEGKAMKTFPIISSAIFDPFGTRTTIDFSNIKVNRGLRVSLFTFSAPEGIEVIKQ